MRLELTRLVCGRRKFCYPPLSQALAADHLKVNTPHGNPSFIPAIVATKLCILYRTSVHEEKEKLIIKEGRAVLEPSLLIQTTKNSDTTVL